MTTDTRAALDAAILAAWQDATHDARCAKEIADDDHSQGHRGSPGDREDCDCATAGRWTALDRAIIAHIEAEVARRLAVAPSVEEAIMEIRVAAARQLAMAPGVDDAIAQFRTAATHAALDPMNTDRERAVATARDQLRDATAHAIAVAEMRGRAAGREDALAQATEIEVAIETLESDAFEHGKCPGTPRGLGLAAAREFKRNALRAAIAADRNRAIRDHDATWQAHDLERDAEVARWQGEAHTLVRAIKSIAAAVGAPEVPSGDGWGERVAAVVIGAIAADRERAANEAERSGYARGRRPFNGAREKPDAPARPTPDEARRLVKSILMAVDMHSREQRAGAVERILLRALGVEA